MTSPPSPQPERLAQLVREARDKQGASQDDVAKAVGVSRQLIALIERGERPDGRPLRPAANTIRALALTLGLDEQELLTLAGREFEVGASQRELMQTVNQLPPHLRQAVTVIAKELHAKHEQSQSAPNGAAA